MNKASSVTETAGARALDVTDLSIAAGSNTLVDAISFHIDRGERVGLIGESGSGKSVTSLAIMGLLPDGVTASGSVLAGDTGTNLLSLGDTQMARRRGRSLSMVFQEPMTALDPLQRIGEQVAEVMTIHRTQTSAAKARARAVELLADVGLPDPSEAAAAYPHQLSGGQRQRVMLAIALANDPALLICDEPTTALDVTVQRQVLELVHASVRERDTGLLFITHDLAVVASVCERVLVMNQGVIVERGTTEEIFTTPQHPYTRGLLAASDLDATDREGRLFTVATAAGYDPTRTLEIRPTPPQPTESAPVGRDIVRAEELTKTYVRTRSSLFGKPARVEALRGLDLTITEGQRFGIVGESGSGKSTLLKIMSGLDRPTSGRIDVVGTALATAKEKDLGELRKNLQIVFQDPMGSLDPRMRVGDIIQEPLLNPANMQSGSVLSRADRTELVAEMLDAVGLSRDSMNRFPHQFSGGQRQRISIARALVCRPRVLVAGEPVSALDVSVRAQVLNLLADLVDEYKLTLIFVSHDLGVVRHVCDSVAVMQQGRIVETGPTMSVYDNPQHPYTKSLVEASPTLFRALEQQP